MKPPLTTKLGIKAGMRAILLHAPPDVIKSLRSDELDVSSRLNGKFDLIHVFLKQQRELESAFARLKCHLRPAAMLWISWPKNGRLESDLTMGIIIRTGYDKGLVESKCVSINPTWSGIKFTFPRAGKTYHNSYGTLRT